MFLSYFLYLNALFAQSLFVYDAVMLALLQIFKLPSGSQNSNFENFLTVSEVDITQFSNASGHLRLRRFGRVVIMQIDLTPTNSNAVQIDLSNGFKLDGAFFNQVTYKNNHIYVYGYTNHPLAITHTTTDTIELVIPYICTP